MIGKTRQMEERYDASVGKARGVIVAPVAPGGKMRHTRRAPPADLAPWIAHYWTVSWDLRGLAPHTAETVPHPNVHLVFDATGVTVNGVQTAKFSTVLEGKSQVFGVKFRVGSFRPFYGAPIAKLADRTIDAAQVFGAAILEFQMVRKEAAWISAMNSFFRARMPAADESVDLADGIVRQILEDQTLRTVDDVTRRVGIGKRSLQRLFSEYVGASPKWVIRRYRLHEALERLHAGQRVSMTDLAHELGYFDQAHLIQDFKSMVGLTPGQYQTLSVRRRSEPL